jgi:uncharacterized ion transporter superfamily protein YfcC
MPKLTFPPADPPLVCTLLAAAASYVTPAGEYERREDPATGRQVAVAYTYHRVPQQPVGAFAAVIAIPRGMADAAAVIFFVFLVGGAFAVVDRTGALRWGVDRLARGLARRDTLVIPISCLAFATGGALEHMSEELIALIPVILVLTRSLGMDAVTAVAMSLGAASVGAAFSPIDPFLVGIAQKVAGLPLLSGGLFRTAFLALAIALWIWGTMRHAARTRTAAPAQRETRVQAPAVAGSRHGYGLLLVVLTFAGFVYGVLQLGWDFEHMALFAYDGCDGGPDRRAPRHWHRRGVRDGFNSMASAALPSGLRAPSTWS